MNLSKTVALCHKAHTEALPCNRCFWLKNVHSVFSSHNDFNWFQFVFSSILSSEKIGKYVNDLITSNRMCRIIISLKNSFLGLLIYLFSDFSSSLCMEAGAHSRVNANQLLLFALRIAFFPCYFCSISINSYW